ncbi:MAG: (deoxy)nucleoside triphosphate pyrophosphohydrolase [Treponema sp.]|nr:(deoxy)nucleoside triphosphate pyrophosphohydrolase [Treponema sp.]
MGTSIACIIYNNENSKILVALRNPTGDMGNRWEFPGGKVDAGENDEQAIVREMSEEFGVKASVGEKIVSSTFTHKEKLCYLNAYMVTLEHDGLSKRFTLTEHQDYKWIDPKEIPSLSFVDSDLKIYPEVMKYLEKLK